MSVVLSKGGAGGGGSGSDAIARKAASDALIEIRALTPQPGETIEAGQSVITPFGTLKAPDTGDVVLDATNPQTLASLQAAGLVPVDSGVTPEALAQSLATRIPVVPLPGTQVGANGFLYTPWGIYQAPAAGTTLNDTTPQTRATVESVGMVLFEGGSSPTLREFNTAVIAGIALKEHPLEAAFLAVGNEAANGVEDGDTIILTTPAGFEHSAIWYDGDNGTPRIGNIKRFIASGNLTTLPNPNLWPAVDDNGRAVEITVHDGGVRSHYEHNGVSWSPVTTNGAYVVGGATGGITEAEAAIIAGDLDDALQSQIDSNKTASDDADDALGVRIDDETAARGVLQTRVTDNEAAIDNAQQAANTAQSAADANAALLTVTQADYDTAQERATAIIDLLATVNGLTIGQVTNLRAELDAINLELAKIPEPAASIEEGDSAKYFTGEQGKAIDIELKEEIELKEVAFADEFLAGNSQSWGSAVNSAFDSGTHEVTFRHAGLLDVGDVSILSKGSAVHPHKIHARNLAVRNRLTSMLEGDFFNSIIDFGTLSLLGSDPARTSVIGEKVRRFNGCELNVDLVLKSTNKSSQVVHASGEDVIDMYNSKININYASNGATETTPTQSSPVIDIDNSQALIAGNEGEVRDTTFFIGVGLGSTDNPVMRVTHDDAGIGVNNKYIINEGENMVGGAVHVANERSARIDVMSYDTATIDDHMIYLVDCPDADITFNNRRGELAEGIFHIKLEKDCDGFYIKSRGYGDTSQSEIHINAGGNEGILVNDKHVVLVNPGNVMVLSTGKYAPFNLTCNFSRAGAIDVAEGPVLGVSAGAVLSDTSLYTITTDFAIPLGAKITAEPYGADAGQRTLVATLVDANTVQVRATATASGNNFTSRISLSIFYQKNEMVFTDNAEALAAGIIVGDEYWTPAGEKRRVL